MPFLPEDVPLIKRGFDIIFSSFSLIILSPILLLLAIALIIFQGYPVLFKQKRPGYRSKPFTIYKFRTMANRKDKDGNLMPEEERITWLGKILRASSMDEILELVNVFKGEMSIVGPRPLLMDYLPRYSPEQARRHDVLPGITGWAQINGRNAISWEEKFTLDVWYVDNWSFWLDIKILLQTIWKVLLREGINQPGFISAGEFMGTNDEGHH